MQIELEQQQVTVLNFLTVANPAEEHGKLGSSDENGRWKTPPFLLSHFFIRNESGTIFSETKTTPVFR